MIQPIVRLGHPALHHPAAEVPEITDEITRLVDDLIDTMYAVGGVGLAAPQIGVSYRVFVVDPSSGRESDRLVVMINPILVTSEGTQTEEEGCLSVPGFEASVHRPLRAVVRGLDAAGKPQEIEGRGLLARAFQHEIDHLDGMLFVDRLRGLTRETMLKKINKLRRSGKW